MLKRYIILNTGSLLAACLVMMMPGIVLSAGFEDQLSIDAQTLYLNGQGPRKKAFLTVYDTALYLTEKGSDAQAIIKADHPMTISLVVRSRFTTAKRISEAFREGLEKATGGNTASIKVQIKEFLSVFKIGVEKNDAFEFVYLPGVGTKIFKNGEAAKSIKGFDFKQALFGIWLSDNPVSVKLKSQLLGQ